jgi:hypothetical protein
MDKKYEPKGAAETSPDEREIDALADRLSLNWAHSPPAVRGAGNQVLQRLARGRIHTVTVERRRTKRSPDGSR